MLFVCLVFLLPLTSSFLLSSQLNIPFDGRLKRPETLNGWWTGLSPQDRTRIEGITGLQHLDTDAPTSANTAATDPATRDAESENDTDGASEYEDASYVPITLSQPDFEVHSSFGLAFRFRF